MRDFYDVLGLPEGLERETYYAKYLELKAKFSDDMFLTGEEGNNAAKALTELESAWRSLESEFDKQKINDEFGSEFGQIDLAIKEGRYDEAQAQLDRLMTRSAEWHYYQSAVFYKREWMAECRKHLVTAVNLDPDNPKYRAALEKLDVKMANPNVPPQYFGNGQYAGSEERMCNGNTLSNCCLAYCCMECCCSMSQCC